ncbi:hypothetical protein PMIN05_008949 [Paraphaeosphaeria minitans]
MHTADDGTIHSLGEKSRRPQILHHHTPAPIRSTCIAGRALRASNKALAQAYAVDALKKRAATGSTNAFTEQPKHVCVAGAQISSLVATIPSAAGVVMDQLPSLSSSAHMSAIDQPFNLQDALEDGAEPAEGNKSNIHVGHLPTNGSFAQSRTCSETDVVDAPTSSGDKKQQSFANEDKGRSGGGVRVPEFSPDVVMTTRSAKQSHRRADGLSQSAPVIPQVPTEEMNTEEPSAEYFTETFAQHATMGAGEPGEPSNVSAAQSEPRRQAVMERMPETLQDSPSKSPTVLDETAKSEEKEQGLYSLTLGEEMTETQNTNVNKSGTTEETQEPATKAECTKLVDRVSKGEEQGFNTTVLVDQATGAQRSDAKLLDTTQRDDTAEQVEKCTTTAEGNQEHKLEDGNQEFYSGLSQEAIGNHTSDMAESGAGSIQRGGSREHTEDPTTLNISPRKTDVTRKRGIGEVRRLEMEVRLAREQAAEAVPENVTTANTENANGYSDCLDGEREKEIELGEATNPEEEQDRSTLINLQQQYQGAQQTQEVEQSEEAEQSQAVEQRQEDQTFSIYDAIERAGIPHNPNQLEAITSCLAKLFGLGKPPNVLSPVPSHVVKKKRSRARRRSKTLHEKLHDFMQGKGTPRSLDTLQSHVKYFGRYSWKTALPNFFWYNSDKDAAYFGRLREETGLRLARSMTELHERDTLLSLFRPEVSSPTETSRVIRGSRDDAESITGDDCDSREQSGKYLRYQDALLLLLNFGTSLPTVTQYSYKNVLAEESSKAVETYNLSTPYVPGDATAGGESSGSQTPTPLGANQRRKAERRQIEELETRLRVLEVENRFLKGMHDKELLDEARVDL